ncbi:Ankyrin repeat and EF-hand domain-containing protein 1 [Stylophora pistillata]|uniref:Ankyrin repeat and EF-hand domain-containing protein 1 n=1 Tax=Stylophora pistillata TaxID=50429 RepID=A0A2B4RKG8_STYPI|nr:Ankyrin repeat and EF-hand domain-containing protein 1 [Stylophora pistillata]
MAFSSNDKRWLVTLVASNKVVAPVLQDIVKQGMAELYAALNNHLNGLPIPCSLQTLTYADVCHLAATPSLASSLKDLSFGNINNNCGVHGKSKKVYNYNSLADDVRENVRNRGSHFNESDWKETVFDQCFDKLKALLQCLPLLPDKKKELLEELSAWKTEGFKRIVDNDVKDLLGKFQNVKLASINEKLDDMPTKDESERVIKKLHSFHTSLMEKLDSMESFIREVHHKLDGGLGATNANPVPTIFDFPKHLQRKEVKQRQDPETKRLKNASTTNRIQKATKPDQSKEKNPDPPYKLRGENAMLARKRIHNAAINGECDVIKLLLESGDNGDQTDKFGLTPLHLAVWYGQRAVVELLLQYGANVDAVDRKNKEGRQASWLGFQSHTTTVTAANASGGTQTEALREIYVNSLALPLVVYNNTTAMNNRSDGLTARVLAGLFTNVSFNNSPVNISINFQSNVHPNDSANGSCL